MLLSDPTFSLHFYQQILLSVKFGKPYLIDGLSPLLILCGIDRLNYQLMHICINIYTYGNYIRKSCCVFICYLWSSFLQKDLEEFTVIDQDWKQNTCHKYQHPSVRPGSCFLTSLILSFLLLMMEVVK